jgi:hypothetical protein
MMMGALGIGDDWRKYVPRGLLEPDRKLSSIRF